MIDRILKTYGEVNTTVKHFPPENHMSHNESYWMHRLNEPIYFFVTKSCPDKFFFSENRLLLVNVLCLECGVNRGEYKSSKTKSLKC